MTNEFIPIEIGIFIFSIISIILGRRCMNIGLREQCYISYLLGGMTVFIYIGILLFISVVLILDITH